ncbi:MAG: hypothetical protein Q4B14_06530 [Clostridia bacterium]|nr:hypothetical protein [Clostridia bacterium]
MITAYERPGVYSDYTVNSVLYSSLRNNVIGIIAVNETGNTKTFRCPK